MTDQNAKYQPADLRLARMGLLAHRALGKAGSGRVEAAFQRSFYVTIDGAWICFLSRAGELGPLNAQIENADIAVLIREQIRVKDPAVVDGNALRIGKALYLRFGESEVWCPPMCSTWDRTSLGLGMTALLRMLRLRSLPKEGLAVLLDTETDDVRYGPVASIAATALQKFSRSLSKAMASDDTNELDAAAIASLLGLGPGLTPSGDDAIGGAMVALHLLGCDRIRDAIWSHVRQLLPHATNKISIAHLEAAAEGYGHAAVHDLLNAVMIGQAKGLARKLSTVAAIGHTSGLDVLVGAALALKAWFTNGSMTAGSAVNSRYSACKS